MEKCAKCNSERIMPKVKVEVESFPTEKGGFADFRLAVDGDPKAFIFRETEYSDISACVCADCGFTEFYASKPEDLYRAYQKTLAQTV